MGNEPSIWSILRYSSTFPREEAALTIFFGYAAERRSATETIRTAAIRIGEESGVTPVLWEDMLVDGTVVISEVLRAIDDAEMCIFDLTDQTENVLFEAGYAVARAKPVWLTFDSTVSKAKASWKELALLNVIGYTAYRNSNDLAEQFANVNPLATLAPIYDALIEPSLDEGIVRDSLLYCLTFEPFEASNRLSLFLNSRRDRGLNMKVSDPRESTLDPLTWFAPNILKSAGVLVHFAGPHRNRASLHNRRHAFVAGMAYGFDVPILMLAEGEYTAPFDYQSLLYKYETAEECVAIARNWLDSLAYEEINWSSPRGSHRSSLSGIRFGEHVAENELLDLPDYFVETAAFESVVSARDTLFVGHRGTGKTANATQAFNQVSANKTNLAVLIKPPGFEFAGLFAVIAKLPEAQKDYFLDSLWRFVIQTEIAASVLARIESKSVYVPHEDAEEQFLSYTKSVSFDLRSDMSIRVEQALNHLVATLNPIQDTAEATRNLINEAFHANTLAELRGHLGPLLKDKKRVAVFVDNLDKGWEKGADFRLVARLIIGLLTARGQLVRDFEKQDFWRDRIKLSLAIFLRSDIFDYLQKEAREPDKLPIATITWRDPETLLGVIENRFTAGDTKDRALRLLWENYFCQEVEGVPTRAYITSVVLPRPRDIVYFCNEAVGRAIDRHHSRVEPADFLSAEETYSQYAYEALLVENGITIPEMEDALLGFLDSPEIITREEIFASFNTAGLSSETHEYVLKKLVSVSFLGLEIRHGVFTYPDVGSSMKKAYAQAAKIFASPEQQRFRINRAFHAFLGITRNGNIDRPT
ncbi:hypothetical protein ABZW11_23020 [Nonomuraea sp. NPDC004580]|uniref:P-loop ATPase, Sll1717 family n=1 Tax=Nonomuraea sp. NPDC004580 TaxID=3154552 RepID=UPI0033AC30D8